MCHRVRKQRRSGRLSGAGEAAGSAPGPRVPQPLFAPLEPAPAGREAGHGQ